MQILIQPQIQTRKSRLIANQNLFQMYSQSIMAQYNFSRSYEGILKDISNANLYFSNIIM